MTLQTPISQAGAGQTNKQTMLIELLARPTGMTLTEAAAATGWQLHSIRGTISAVLKKKLGLNIVCFRGAEGEGVYRLLHGYPNAPIVLSHNNIGLMTGRQSATISASSLPLKQISVSTHDVCTVADIIRNYMTHYAREGKGVSVTTTIINAHILPTLGDINIRDLTTKLISDWHYALSKTPARLRTGKNAELRNMRDMSDDSEVARRRKSTANRILIVLKAALNHAWREGTIDSDLAWRRVKPFRGVTAPVIRYLEEAECRQLVKACEPDLRLVVQAALFTGCRYGEICRLVAADYRPDTGMLYISITKSGKPRHVVLTNEGRQFFDKVTRDNSSKEPLFKRQSGEPWVKSAQSRRMRVACKKAGIEPAISYHILRHTYGSLLAMQGTPMAVVAKQLGHANTQMTEKHYAHISPDYVSQMVRDNFPNLNIS